MEEQNEQVSQVSLQEQIQGQQEQQSLQDIYNCTIQLQKDLEFIQLLANPEYVIQLHMRGYLYDERFQQYIQKLNYLNNQKYITLIKYPEGLFNLERVKSKGFAEFLKNPQNANNFRKISQDRNDLINKMAH